MLFRSSSVRLRIAKTTGNSFCREGRPLDAADLVAIRAFIDEDSPHYAAVVLSRLIAATERLAVIPESGRSVPEFQSPVVGEVILRPYRRRFSIGPPRPMVSP